MKVTPVETLIKCPFLKNGKRVSPEVGDIQGGVAPLVQYFPMKNVAHGPHFGEPAVEPVALNRLNIELLLGH